MTAPAEQMPLAPPSDEAAMMNFCILETRIRHWGSEQRIIGPFATFAEAQRHWRDATERMGDERRQYIVFEMENQIHLRAPNGRNTHDDQHSNPHS